MASLMNGLSAMGAAISNTAGSAALEAQKADLQQQALTLASNLAGARESAGRAEEHGYRTSELGTAAQYQQQLEGLKSASAEKVAGIGASATLGSAHIAADAALAVADTDTKAAATRNAATILATGNSVQVDADTGATTIVNSVDKSVTPMLGADGKPFIAQNPAIAKNIVETISATREIITNLTNQRAQDVRAAQQAVNDAMTNQSLIPGSPQRAKAISDAQENLAATQQRYDALQAPWMRQMQGLAAALVQVNNPAARAAADAAAAKGQPSATPNPANYEPNAAKAATPTTAPAALTGTGGP